MHPRLPYLMLSQRSDGTVIAVFGPPLRDIDIGPGGPPSTHLSQEDSRMVVPRVLYKCGDTQRGRVPKPTTYPPTLDRLGVKLSDAIHETFKGMNDRDDSPFNEECRGITIRMHVGS